MTSSLFILILLVLTALQSRLPTAWWLGGLRVEFLPALVVYATLSLPRGRAVAFALAAGFLQDALSAGPFGLHAAAYSTVTVILTGLHDYLDRELPFIQIGAGAVMTVAASLTACIAAGFPNGAVMKLFILAVSGAVITPVLFLALDALRYVLRREP